MSSSILEELGDFCDKKEVVQLLEGWARKYNFTLDFLKYLSKFLDDVFDMPPDNRMSHIQAIERDLSKAEYELNNTVGKGAFGSVWKGKRKSDGIVCAVKIIDLEASQDDILTISKEIATLSNSRTCPQLIAYFGSVVFRTDLWIAMEYVSRGSVSDLVKRQAERRKASGGGPCVALICESAVAVIAREVLLGLDYLARDGRLHRDIKAANILLSENGQVKLADFGASSQLTDTRTKCNTFVGSPYWMAPEVLSEEKYDGKADIWSLGITIYELFVGKPPHANLPPLRVINHIPTAPAPQLPKDLTTVPAGTNSPSPAVSAECVDFLKNCLVKDPKMRADIGTLLRHPFIANAGRNDILTAYFM